MSIKEFIIDLKKPDSKIKKYCIIKVVKFRFKIIII